MVEDIIGLFDGRSGRGGGSNKGPKDSKMSSRVGLGPGCKVAINERRKEDVVRESLDK